MIIDDVIRRSRVSVWWANQRHLRDPRLERPEKSHRTDLNQETWNQMCGKPTKDPNPTVQKCSLRTSRTPSRVDTWLDTNETT